MFMLVNKAPYMSCANYVEMWVFEAKKVHFVSWNKEKYS